MKGEVHIKDDYIVLGCRSLIKSYNSTTFEESDISDAYIVRVDGTQYEYDDENHLIKSKDGISETLYEEYYNDNPTKVTIGILDESTKIKNYKEYNHR